MLTGVFDNNFTKFDTFERIYKFLRRETEVIWSRRGVTIGGLLFIHNIELCKEEGCIVIQGCMEGTECHTFVITNALIRKGGGVIYCNMTPDNTGLFLKVNKDYKGLTVSEAAIERGELERYNYSFRFMTV